MKSRTLEQQNVHKEDNWRTSGDEERQPASPEPLTVDLQLLPASLEVLEEQLLGRFSSTSRFTLELSHTSYLCSPRTRARVHKRTKQTP